MHGSMNIKFIVVTWFCMDSDMLKAIMVCVSS